MTGLLSKLHLPLGLRRRRLRTLAGRRRFRPPSRLPPGTAEQYLSLPGSGARNGSDLRTYEKEGVEYLDTESYRCMEASSAPALWGGPGAYTTIQADGCARWYRVGDLAADL